MNDVITQTQAINFILLLFVAAAFGWLSTQVWVEAPFNAVCRFISGLLFIVAVFEAVVFLIRLVV